jgi:multidrug resistance efflux pump
MVAADLAERNARLALLEAGPRAEEVEVARLAVARIDEKLRYSRAELERIRGLGATEVVSRKEVEVAEQATAVLANELDGERARLRMLMAGSRPEEMAAVREEIARSDAELRHLESQIARAWVVAPHGGVVATPKPREKVGEHVEPGDLIAEVYAVETVTAEVAIPEQDVGEVRVDQRGSVRLRAFPDQALEGRVIAVAPAAVDVPGQRGRVVRATIELPNAGGRVKPSMTGYARIHCGRRSALDVLSRPLRRFFRLELWSWW